MNLHEKIKYFQKHSSKFFDDHKLKNIDHKHSKIIKSAYTLAADKNQINSFGLRSWKEQNDIPVPFQISWKTVKFYGPIEYLKKLLTFLVKKKSEAFLKSAMQDDIEILRSIGADYIISENPVSGTPGVRQVYFYKDFVVNMRWLRYIYLTHQILQKNLIKNNEVWVDVGSFYGGLQGIVKKYLPKVKFVLVDFHHQLCRSFVYLSTMYPNEIHLLPDKINKLKSLSDIPNGAFAYVPTSQFKKIKTMSCSLSSNFVSFGEMQKKEFKKYYNSNLFKKSERSYLVNRFVSAPFFEQTYDSTLKITDYLRKNKQPKYFDIFPLHTSLFTKRKLFNRCGFRPIASQNFELIF